MDILLTSLYEQKKILEEFIKNEKDDNSLIKNQINWIDNEILKLQNELLNIVYLKELEVIINLKEICHQENCVEYTSENSIYCNKHLFEYAIDNVDD